MSDGAMYPPSGDREVADHEHLLAEDLLRSPAEDAPARAIGHALLALDLRLRELIVHGVWSGD